MSNDYASAAATVIKALLDDRQLGKSGYVDSHEAAIRLSDALAESLKLSATTVINAGTWATGRPTVGEKLGDPHPPKTARNAFPRVCSWSSCKVVVHGPGPRCSDHSPSAERSAQCEKLD